MEDTVKICKWPNDVWCEWDELEGYLQWMSDDFEVLNLTDAEYEEFLKVY